MVCSGQDRVGVQDPMTCTDLLGVHMWEYRRLYTDGEGQEEAGSPVFDSSQRYRIQGISFLIQPLVCAFIPSSKIPVTSHSFTEILPEISLCSRLPSYHSLENIHVGTH